MWATGFPYDHAVAERIYAMLSVQMVTEADTALKHGGVLTHVHHDADPRLCIQMSGLGMMTVLRLAGHRRWKVELGARQPYAEHIDRLP